MDYERIAKWVVETVLIFGGTAATAHQVAGLFVAAIAAERKEGKKDA